MGLDAEALFLQPFGDVVVLANTALVNSEAEQDSHMTVAARSLLREAERAKRKVEAVWKTEVEKHGDAFRAMMVQQGSVETKRFHLESLLWDFEDVVYPDSFEPHRYKALQTAVRALALDVVETSKRLNPIALSAPPTPTGGFPPLPPLPLRQTKARKRSLRSGDAETSVDSQPGLASKTSFPELPGHANLETFLDDFWEERTKGGANLAGRLATSTTSSDPFHDTETLAADDTIPSSPSLDDDTSNLITPTVTAEAQPLTAIANPSEITLSTSIAAEAPPKPETDDGPILFNEFLDEETKPLQKQPNRNTAFHPRTVTPDCTIREDSTYHRFGGLCRGAVKFRQDGHWGSIVRTTEHSGSGGDMLRASDGIMPFQYDEAPVQVARCGDCSYSQSLDEVLDDMENKATPLPTPHGDTSYRPRLLFKSHLPHSTLPSVPCYACPWCVATSTTPHPSDATVFLSPTDLLRHLARHPQPLPPLHGTTVVYGPAPDPPAHPFDLHLPSSPIPVPMPYNVTANLPTAVATRDEYRRPGRTKLEGPPGGSYAGEMLEFLRGGVIVGVLFPGKWGGKWCLGRHDGVFGAFPARAVEMRLPPEGQGGSVVPPPPPLPPGGPGGMRVTTKWKWLPPEGRRGWLAFGKGEVIRDVRYRHVDCWVWWGTNGKGETGVFPSSHVLVDTLRPEEVGKDKTKRRGLFSRAGSTSRR